MNNRIVILGGGVGGLSVARALRFVPAHITLVDRSPLHLTQSRLYAAATGQTLPRGLQYPFQHQTNIEFAQDEAVYLDARRGRLVLSTRAIPYDVLVVAAGSQSHYEREEWQRTAPGLKSADDAGRIREKLRDLDTTAVILGGGVAGTELAAAVALADRSRRVALVESGTRLLATFPEELATEARCQLERLGIEVHFGLHAIGMDSESVSFSGPRGRERIRSRAVLWAGGTKGSAFGAVLRRETGTSLDDRDRVCVCPDLTIPEHPEIFVIGDLARVLHEGSLLEGLATVASQEGRHVASVIRARMAGYPSRPFEYVEQGRFAILGRGGVGMLGDAQLRGYPAWLAAKLAQRLSSPLNIFPHLHSYSVATGSRT